MKYPEIQEDALEEALEPFHNIEKIEFKPEFIEHYSKLIDFETFKKYSLSFLRRSIRINTLKISVEIVKKRLEKEWNLTPIPWCKEGFWIVHKGEHKGEHNKEHNGDGKACETKRRDIGNLIEHSLGFIYVQEAASMIPPIVLEPLPSEIILDMCAAPGSKATQIAQYMQNKGLLVANDVTYQRIQALGINMQRCGITNAVITQMFGHWFKGFKFDRILLDAPCSGTGTIRKSVKTLMMWSRSGIKKLAGQQRQLIDVAFNNLKENGVLVYSTCSNEPEEDEAIVSFLLEKYSEAVCKKIELPLKHSEPIMEFEGKQYHKGVRNCLRLWPQDNDTEGFFVARIRKEKY